MDEFEIGGGDVGEEGARRHVQHPGGGRWKLS
jgi:hypothetical protein